MAKRRGNNEGWIKQMPDGSWKGAVQLGFDNNGRAIRKWFKRKTRAAVQAEIRTHVQKKERNEPLNSAKKTVAQYMAEWLDVYIRPIRSPLTYCQYQHHIRNYIEPMLGRIPLERLTGKDVQKMMNDLSDSGLSPATVRNVNAALISALSQAVQDELVDRNAAKASRPPKQVKYEAKPLDEEQTKRLMRFVASHQHEAMFLVAVVMGLRRAETVGLRWEDIDFDNRKMHVRLQLQRLKGKGAVLLPLKSETSRRDLDIPPFIIQALLRRKAQQLADRRAAGDRWRDGDAFVFTSAKGVRVEAQEAYRQLKLVLAASGMPHIRFHDLRHSAASLMLAMGADLKTIQMVLGHSSITLTADLYGHLVGNQIHTAMQKMDTAFAAASTGATLQ